MTFLFPLIIKQINRMRQDMTRERNNTRRYTTQKKPFLLRAILSVTLFILALNQLHIPLDNTNLLLRTVRGQDCFPRSESKFPKILMKQTGHDNDIHMKYYTVIQDAAGNNLYAGGYFKDAGDQISYVKNDEGAFITRTDLVQNSVVWTKTISRHGDDKIRSINALALDPNEDFIMVYANEEKTLAKGHEKFWMIKIRVVDGMRDIASTVVEFKHKDYKFVTKSQGMLWTSATRVYMAFQMFDDGTDPKSFRMGVYDPSNKRFWEHRYHQKEGFISSFAYQGSAPIDQRFVFGGCYKSSNWGPAIHIVKADLQENQQAQIEYAQGTQFQQDSDNKQYVDHIRVAETDLWVYGSTRSYNNNAAGQFTSVFKIKQHSTTRKLILGNTSANILWTQLGGIATTSHIIGISEYDNSFGGFHIVFFSAYQQGSSGNLYHMKCTFNQAQTSATAQMIVQGAIEMPHALFRPLSVGTTQNVGSETILEGYAVGWNDSFTGTSTVSTTGGGEAGAIYSFLPNMSCEAAPNSSISVTLTHRTSAKVAINDPSTMEDQDFDNGSPNDPDDDDVDANFFDLRQDLLTTEASWCSSYSQSIVTYSAGSVSNGGQCGVNWDNSEDSIPFTAPAVVDPSTCTDPPTSVTYSLTFDTNFPEYDHGMLSIDSTNSEIRVLPLTGGSDTDIYTFTVNAVFPSGHLEQFNFILGFGSGAQACDSETLSKTPTHPVAYTYANTGVQQTGEVDAGDFSATGGCTIRFETLISPTNTAKIWARSDGRGANWNSSDPTFAQTFTVTVKASIGCSTSETTSYTVTFGQNCAGDTFTIDPLKFASPALTYNLHDSSQSLFWTDSEATSTNGYTTCGGLTWTITAVSPTLLSPAFTVDSNAATKSIVAYSQNQSHAITHTLNVKVEYASYTMSSQSDLDFTIVIANPCETSLSVANSPNLITATPNYVVGASMQTENAFSAWTISPNYCPVTYHVQPVSPNPSDNTAITTDASTRITTIQTDDIAMGLTVSDTTPETFSMVYFVNSPAGTSMLAASEIVTVTFTVENPCVADTPTISGVLAGETLSYTIQDPMHPVTVDQTSAAQGITSPPTCPGLEWTLTADPSGTHDAIFNFNTGGANPVIETFTNDFSKAGTYNLLLLAKYAGAAYTNQATLQFTMTIIDPCLSPTLTLTPPASGTTIVYNYVGSSGPRAVFQFDSITIIPSICTYTFSCTCAESTDLCSMSTSPSLSVFTASTGKLEIETPDVLNVTPGDYTVTITGTAGTSGGVTETQQVIFRLVNPCPTALLTDATSFVDQTYIIQSASAPSAQTWPQYPATSNTAAYCGDMVLTFALTGGGTLPGSININYVTRQIGISATTDLSEHASYPFEFTIHYADYPPPTGNQITSTQPNFTLTLTDECRSPTILVDASTVTSAGTYNFDNLSPLSFDMTGVTVSPTSCTLTYACSVTADPGPTIDATFQSTCVYPGPETSFTPASGTFQIASLAVPLFQMGAYTLTILISSGTAGFVSQTSHSVTLTLVNPCPGATLSIQSHTMPATTTYSLRQNALPIDYSNIVVQSTTPADCGIIDKAFSELTFNDMSPFTNDVANSDFVVDYTEDVNRVKLYTIQFEASYADYAGVTPTQLTFQIDIVDPCASPLSLTATSILDTSYTITQAQHNYPFTAFTSNPAWCAITYTTSQTPVQLNLLSLDPPNLRFQFFENASLAETSIVGPTYQQTYSVILSASVGYTIPKTAMTSFNVQVNNPCVDPAYNTILTPSVLLQDPEIYYVNTNKKIIPIDQLYCTMSTLCGPVTMTLAGNTSPQIVAQQAPADLQFEVYTSDATLIGFTEIVTVDSALANYASVIGAQIQIPIEFKECVVTDFVAPTISKQSYELGAQKVTFEGPIFTSQHISSCNFVVTYTAQLSEVDPSTGTTQLPSVIQFDPLTRQFTLEGTSSSPGIYKVEMIGTLNNPGTDFYQAKFEVEITSPPPADQYTISNNFAPAPDAKLNSKHLFVMDETTSGSSTQLIGKVSDAEGDQFTVQLVGSAPVGTTFVTSGEEIFLDIDSEKVKEGNYTIRFVVTEQVNATHTKAVEHSFSFEVKDLKEKELEQFQVDFIKWEQEAKNPAEPPTFTISNIDMFGNVTLTFSESIIVPQNITYINQTVFDVKILPQNPSIIDELGFYWETVEFTNLQATFNIKFDSPLVVSQEMTKDILEVTVKDPTLLVSTATFKRVQNETSDEYKIPVQQVDIKAFQQTVQVVDGAKSTMLIGTGTSFALNFLLMGSLSLLWGLIHAMQIVAHFPLLNIVIPSNALVLYMALFEMANFDVIPTGDLKEFMMSKYYQQNIDEDTSAVHDKLLDPHMTEFFDDADPFHEAMPPIAIVSSIISVLLFARFVVWLFSSHQYAVNMYERLKAKIFWNSFLRLFFEEYLVLSITCLLKIQTLSFSGLYQSFSSLFALITFSVILLSIPAVWFGLFKNFKTVRRKAFQKKYGSLTLDLDVNNKMALLYQVFFMLRRVLLAIMVVFLPRRAFFQVQFLVLKCSVIMIFIGQVKPYKKMSMNNLELFNEFMILQNSYFVLLFTDFVLRPIKNGDEWISDSEMKYQLGWVNIAWLAILIGTNFFCMLGLQISDIYKRAKLAYMKRKMSRNQAKLAQKSKPYSLNKQQLSKKRHQIGQVPQVEDASVANNLNTANLQNQRQLQSKANNSDKLIQHEQEDNDGQPNLNWLNSSSQAAYHHPGSFWVGKNPSSTIQTKSLTKDRYGRKDLQELASTSSPDDLGIRADLPAKKTRKVKKRITRRIKVKVVKPLFFFNNEEKSGLDGGPLDQIDECASQDENGQIQTIVSGAGGIANTDENMLPHYNNNNSTNEETFEKWAGDDGESTPDLNYRPALHSDLMRIQTNLPSPLNSALAATSFSTKAVASNHQSNQWMQKLEMRRQFLESFSGSQQKQFGGKEEQFSAENNEISESNLDHRSRLAQQTPTSISSSNVDRQYKMAQTPEEFAKSLAEYKNAYANIDEEISQAEKAKSTPDYNSSSSYSTPGGVNGRNSLLRPRPGEFQYFPSTPKLVQNLLPSPNSSQLLTNHNNSLPNLVQTQMITTPQSIRTQPITLWENNDASRNIALKNRLSLLQSDQMITEESKMAENPDDNDDDEIAKSDDKEYALRNQLRQGLQSQSTHKRIKSIQNFVDGK